MIAKLPVLGFTLLTALGAPALAHADCREPPRAPAHHGGPRGGGPAPRATWQGRAPEDIVLAQSDLDRDGWITLNEALDRGRRDFRRNDKDGDRRLTRREMDRSEIARHDRDRDGRMSFAEHQSAVRAHFARLDSNRDGYLARYEIERSSGRVRSTGWRR